MAGMLEYKCPCCDGAIQFDSATQKMKCPYCDTEFDVDTLKGYDEELKDEKPSEMEWATPGGSWAEGETAGLHTYSCKSCGGEIVGDDTMAASACPFCGNPIVLTGQFAGTLRPDLIIPFKLDKKAAKAKLQEHLKGKTLLPRVFRSQNHIDEIKGVYKDYSHIGGYVFWIVVGAVPLALFARGEARRYHARTIARRVESYSGAEVPLRWLCNSVGMDTKDIAWYFENGYFANLSLDLNQKIVRRRTVPRHDPNRG